MKKPLAVTVAALTLTMGATVLVPAAAPIEAAVVTGSIDKADAYIEYYVKKIRCQPFSSPAKMRYDWFRRREHNAWEKFWGLKDFDTYSHSTILDFKYVPHPNYCNAFGYPQWL